MFNSLYIYIYLFISVITVCNSSSLNNLNYNQEVLLDKSGILNNEPYVIKNNREHVVYQETNSEKIENINLKDYEHEIHHVVHKHNHQNNQNSNKLIANNHKKKTDELLVNTQNGFVRGKNVYAEYLNPLKNHKTNIKKKQKLNAWLGIPFAEKPIGDLRFKRPVPIKNWNGILNATQLPNTCYQLPDTVIPDFWGVEMWNANTNISEDCLYLNIWSPHPKPQNAPVMVKTNYF